MPHKGIRLSHVLKGRAATFTAAQTDYKTNVATVNQVLTNIFSSALPTLQVVPPDWNDYVSTYENATGVALSWVNSVMARLLEVPDDILGYNDTVVGSLSLALSTAQQLESDPTSLALKNQLHTTLKNMLGVLRLIITFIEGAITSVQKFKDQIPTLSTQLQSIADKSAKDAKADQDQLKDFQQKIDNLKSDINSKTAAIIALSIADGIALTIGTVATIALWPVGALVWFVMGPAVAVATTFIALDSIAIQNDKKQIDAYEQTMTGYTASVATLNTLNSTYSGLSSQASGLDGNLQSILAEWKALETGVNNAIADINEANTTSDWKGVVTDIQAAQTEWSAAYAQAGSLKLDIQVNNAQLKYGLSSAQVGEALAKGQTMDVVTYYNTQSGLLLAKRPELLAKYQRKSKVQYGQQVQ